MKNIAVHLEKGPAKTHSESNRRYLLSLDIGRLLANFYIQAGLNSNIHTLPKHYGGWEEADSQVHGNIVGHYMSACAMRAYYDNDMELRARAIQMVDELERCQNENEDGWCASIPPVYLDRIVRNKWVWAPHYNVHKTFMGLADVYKYCNYSKAEQIIDKWSDWFLRWTNQFDEEKMQDILDWETGGMMEVWADLYALTGKEKYHTLMKRYTHYRFFNPILEGKDILTNTHANTTIPEAHGMARAYQVTGEEIYRRFAEGYLEQVLELRDHYCTGGQTAGEVWIDHLTYADLGIQNQEHCSVYNMIRLCEYIMTWNPQVRYADYIEKNICNGLMAQHRIKDGMNTYYLPLGAGVRKDWSTPENHMTCCLGTTLQANASYEGRILFEDETDLVVSQYIPCTARWLCNGNEVDIKLTSKSEGNNNKRPELINNRIHIKCPYKADFTVTVRAPAWSEETVVMRNGKEIARLTDRKCKWINIPGEWQDDIIEVICKRSLSLSQLGKTNYYAVLYGAEALAGLTDDPGALRHMDLNCPEKSIMPRAVRDWVASTTTWQSTGQERNIVLKALHEIDEEEYTVYFECDKKE